MQTFVGAVMPILDLDREGQFPPLKGQDDRQSFLCMDEQVISFCQTLSALLLNDRKARSFADIVTFAYFCRKANIQAISATLHNRDRRQGWGRLIHIAPSNIPVNFAFSLMMGLLSGNTNYVRLPSKAYSQIEIIVAAIEAVLQQDQFASMTSRILFFRCKRDSSILKLEVGRCDGVVVWGGDQTVAAFRALNKQPRCVELYFPNRVSCLIMNAEQVMACDSIALRRVFQNFYNDTYLVDQNACSSPNIIYWVGNKAGILSAQEKFWEGFQAFLSEKMSPAAGILIEKQLDLLRNIHDCKTELAIRHYGPYIWLFQNRSLSDKRLRYGSFLQVELCNLEDIVGHIRTNEQTVTYFGLNKEKLAACLLAKGRIVDRIVPIGQALAIGVHWDGKSILANLSHEMDVL